MNQLVKASHANTMAVYERIQDPLAFCKQMAKPVAAMMGCNQDQGESIALAILCEGVTVSEFMRRNHWIPGKGPSMRSDAMLAEFRMNHAGSYEIISNTPYLAEINFTDASGKEYNRKLTARDCLMSRWPWSKSPGWKTSVSKAAQMFGDGETEQVVLGTLISGCGDNWGTLVDWQNMLWARLVSSSLRVICPELVAGVYTPEELQSSATGEIKSATAVTLDDEAMKKLNIPSSEPEEEAVDASFEVVDGEVVVEEPAPTDDSPIVVQIKTLAGQYFGDQDQEQLQGVLDKYGATSWQEMEEATLVGIRDKLEAAVGE